MGVWLFCSACVHHPEKTQASTADSLSGHDSAGSNFFPVADVLLSEIRLVDSLPMAIKEYRIRNGRTDSGYIKPAEFHTLAMQFLVPEFRDGSFEKDFTENSFMDNNTQEATFTYSAGNPDLPLQRVDVIAAPQGMNHQMKSIYLERKRTAGDSSILDKMYWRAGKSFEIISMVRIKGGSPAEQRLKVAWGAGEDNE
jgi:hypothetical protein